jgi:hypothetical protein
VVEAAAEALSNTRSLRMRLAMVSSSACVSPFASPTKHSNPGPIDETTAPSTCLCWVSGEEAGQDWRRGRVGGRLRGGGSGGESRTHLDGRARDLLYHRAHW